MFSLILLKGIPMKIMSSSFKDGEMIPGDFAFAVQNAETHIQLSSNLNPHLAWEGVPEGTQSFVVVVHDPDVPSKGDDVNQDNRVVPATLPRVEFFHWLLLDIPASTTEIIPGSHSQAVVPRGKTGPSAPDGLRHGINDYTSWFVGDAQMEGNYFGYDGPCPPWNDELVHRYVFTLYALSVPTLEVIGDLSGPNVLAALDKDVVIATATLTGLYTLNPSLKVK